MVCDVRSVRWTGLKASPLELDGGDVVFDRADLARGRGWRGRATSACRPAGTRPGGEGRAADAEPDHRSDLQPRRRHDPPGGQPGLTAEVDPPEKIGNGSEGKAAPLRAARTRHDRRLDPRRVPPTTTTRRSIPAVFGGPSSNASDRDCPHCDITTGCRGAPGLPPPCLSARGAGGAPRR